MKIKVLLFSLVSILFLTISSGQVASASVVTDSPIDLSTTIDYDNLQITETDGSTLNFDNIDDMKIYVANFKKPQKDGVEPYVYGKTIVGTQYKNYQFMGYSKYTKEWAKPSAYTTQSSDSQTFSHKISTKWGDTTASYSQSKGVSRTIPANKKKWSRLAGYADLKIVRHKITQPSFGTIYTTKVTKLNSYIAVKYK
ncbi:MAG TPA: hypothetical protein IAA20_07715 [Candidatus Enterococcus avicola]|uniref:DUF5626 domain-containing protein n=1 Tax=Candidatus Enterococcus avicola TaxID=2838561 RepID=A0A9D2F871_9ENTE|nr:hypothetical protein [Candidatus Enterococcus avicola]